MPFVSDRVADTTTTTGTGTLTLLGVSPTGFPTTQSFSSGFGSATVRVSYAIDDGVSGWEVGEGTLSGGNSLTRELVRSSSNNGALVSFSSGTKSVFNTATSEMIHRSNLGLQLASNLGWALP